MEYISSQISDLFGLIYKNLIREEADPVLLSTNSRNAVLAVLYRDGPLPMNMIGEHLRVTKGNITFLVDKLEKDGFIKRERSSNDRRKINIEITKKGAAVIENERQLRMKNISSHLEKLDSSEMDRLADAVQTIRQIIEKV